MKNNNNEKMVILNYLHNSLKFCYNGQSLVKMEDWMTR